MQITIFDIINEVNKENMKELELKKPIGDFIIKNAKGTQTESGTYYHYSEVCKLLRSYKKHFELNEIEVIDHEEIKPNEN